MKKSQKKVSLVLGSGGARGYAHIGVIEELEKKGYEIVSISGSSMGALIGGLYACGKMQEYKKWVINLDAINVASLLDIAWDARGFIRGSKVFDKLSDMIGNKKIEELKIPYTAVATDIKRNKEVWFQKGDILEAIRASISIPSIFTPIEKEGMLLVDGGVLNPLPIAPTMSDHSDITIAVNLYGNLPKPKIYIPEDIKGRQGDMEHLIKTIKAKAQNLISKKDTVNDSYSLFDIIDMTLDSMQDTLIRYRLAEYPPDIMIGISKDVCGVYDFHKAYEVIEAGRMAAKEVLEDTRLLIHK